MEDKLKLLMGRPLVVDAENGIAVHQPALQEIVDMGEEAFNQIVLPFVITTDLIFAGLEKEEELIEEFDIFDLFFIEVDNGKTILDGMLGGNSAVDALKKSLIYFFKTEDIRILKARKKIVINNKYLIEKEQFKVIRKAVQLVVNRNEIEVEKPPKNMSKRQKDIWTKLQKGRRRSSEKNMMYVQDIINFVIFGGKSYIPIREIETMTYYQLQNAYRGILGVDAYEMGMQYKLSQKFDVKDDVKHWTETIKIGK
jgi:hypothetical protein